MYYVYVIENNEGGLYFGRTKDLKRRLSEPQAGESPSTKNGQDWKLIYYEAYATESDAVRRERRIKYYGQAWNQLKKRLKDSRQHEI